MRKGVVGMLCFTAGVVIASLVFISFPKQKEEIEPVVVYNENQIISNMIAEFDELPGDPWASFSLSYYPAKRPTDTPSFYVNVDYGDVSHKEVFETYKEFISYISSPEKYHTRVVEVSK